MSDITQQVEQFQHAFDEIRTEIGRVIVGNKEIVEGALICLFMGGHALLEGVPGLGKTLLVRTLAETVRLKFNRIQFTPDLMPADITGTTILSETPDGKREFRFQPGPVFANVLLADEINRATPKTQSALLEAMQERSVTVGGVVHKLEEPFLVLATQNPIEMEGTYPLPEAQLDRFLFKLLVYPPNFEELSAIVDRTTGEKTETVRPVLDGPTILQWRQLARAVPIAPNVQEFALRLILGTHPTNDEAPRMVKQFVRFGSSPRGAQALILASKIRALTKGRYNVAIEDIVEIAKPALRHRILLNFEGQAEGIVTDSIIEELIAHTQEALKISVGV
ncbi:MoxR-like ATPase [Chthonomonas calidirosea]|uniref:MoxR-like ATPases n=1 Tax=Chthonomonas calidirosea (strain DSM 23976 / ICMP 18418 / T49) TaxID=1303518 RepID=S0ETU8_CHTCT|nr:MoxR family ATPase [Chthonomonas calidirosea]CCW34655.1 MoxR-like ATPases [Chthonomonas calidirosea T49]CEK13026.1 MoxR-like ATPase [Chthonomonas calidirosea]CEK14167.1 MoxR-like ATPase [Chthonomonas calidirosea]